ncbi:MAG TPA: GvpL/GvpF family gas vesicle protein [Gaiellaceae bacterium]|nr:GvpL/GvpF family gas vesicle protein [Gaiellaceae bacterium]
MIHVYGIVEELSKLPQLTGVEGARLDRRCLGGLELVTSDRAEAEVTQEAVLDHAAVVDELMSRSATVLPAQFGRPFGDERELSVAILARAETLAWGLDRVRGCVEFGVRIAGPADAPAAGSGFAYMRKLLAQERAATKIREPLEALSRSSTPGAYLVQKESVSAFREAVERLAADQGELTVVCTGPWPPYSFGAEAA